jgi:hypothetical protein
MRIKKPREVKDEILAFVPIDVGDVDNRCL